MNEGAACQKPPQQFIPSGPLDTMQDFIAAHPGRLTYDGPRARKFGTSLAMDGYFLMV